MRSIVIMSAVYFAVIATAVARTPGNCPKSAASYVGAYTLTFADTNPVHIGQNLPPFVDSYDNILIADSSNAEYIDPATGYPNWYFTVNIAGLNYYGDFAGYSVLTTNQGAYFINARTGEVAINLTSLWYNGDTNVFFDSSGASGAAFACASPSSVQRSTILGGNAGTGKVPTWTYTDVNNLLNSGSAMFNGTVFALFNNFSSNNVVSITVTALDVVSGVRRWSRTQFNPDMSGSNSAQILPDTYRPLVYLLTVSATNSSNIIVQAFDTMTGALAWTRAVPAQYPNDVSNYPLLFVGSKYVYFNDGRSLYAINKETGQTQQAPPTPGIGSIFVNNEVNGVLLGYNAGTTATFVGMDVDMNIKWSTVIGNASAEVSGAYYDDCGRAYVQVLFPNYGSSGYSGYFSVFDAVSGKVLWSGDEEFPLLQIPNQGMFSIGKAGNIYAIQFTENSGFENQLVVLKPVDNPDPTPAPLPSTRPQAVLFYAFASAQCSGKAVVRVISAFHCRNTTIVPSATFLQTGVACCN